MNAERDADSNWELDMYSVGYSRDANKSFTKHGMKTAPLSTLIFGKDSFNVGNALTPALTSDYSEEFNANLNATQLFPRVSYSETGINLGTKLGYRVWNGKGLVGLKVNVPLKTVRMERDNNAETNEQGFGVNVVRGQIGTANVPTDPNVVANPGGGNPVTTTAVNVVSNMYRVSFIKDLPVLDGGLQHGLIAPSTAIPADTSVALSPYAKPLLAQFGNDAAGNPKYVIADNIPYAFFYQKDPKLAPSIKNRAMRMPATVRQDFGIGAGAEITIANVANIATNVINNTFLDLGSTTPAARVFAGNNAGNPADPAPFAPLKALPIAGADLQENVLYAPVQGNAVAYDALFKDYGDKLWIMTTHDQNGVLTNNGAADGALNRLLDRYAATSAEQWLWMNGFTMQNNQRTGLGDITVNPCYDHSFSAAWQGGVYAHVLIPTGGSRKGGENPYKARLGNDNHVELGGGANVAWQALDWMNIRLDAMAAYALPAKERVALPIKGATVKAIGPVVDADIDYTRVKASLDTTLVHPKASSLATTIGYDFEFKTKDNVSLKDKTYTFKPLANDANSWFGGFWDNAAPAGFKDRKVELDSAVLSKNTESISHNIRVESSWHATEKLSLFWGGSAPIAGQYVAKMTSIYGGINVKY
jgi:hypothetical protein